MKQKQTHVSHTDVLWNSCGHTSCPFSQCMCFCIMNVSLVFSLSRIIESLRDVWQSLIIEWLLYLFHESFYAHRCNVHSKCTFHVSSSNLPQKPITEISIEKVLNDYPEQVDAWWKSPLCGCFTDCCQRLQHALHGEWHLVMGQPVFVGSSHWFCHCE